MDLWIRSQDKLLLEKVQTLKVAQYKNKNFNEVDFTFGIVVNNDYVFGDYVTKERALEVLGEIDERIMLLNTLSIAKDRDTLLALKNALPEEKLQGLAYPYEMPKE